MDPKKYYATNTKEDKNDVTQYPMMESAVIDRDFILICKGLWKFFKTFYGGIEIKRFAIDKDKIGQLYRDVFLPTVKVAIMRRGERLKMPKFVTANYRTTLLDFKRHLKSVFYMLSDPSLSAQKDIRIWMIDPTKMNMEEFMDSYNQGIADNMVHSFDFPGKVLPDSYPVEIQEF